MDKEEFRKKCLDYTKKTIKIGAEIADLAMKFQDKKTPLGLLVMASKGINVYQENFSKNPRTFFNDWKFINFSSLENFVIDFLAKNKQLDTETKNYHGQSGTQHIVRLGDNLQIGWHQGTYGSYGPFIPSLQSEEQTFNIIGDIIYSNLKNSILDINKNSDFNIQLEFKKDELNKFLPSEKGKEIYENDIKPFLDKNISRALLLYGPPGTGKSYIMKYIGSLVGDRTLRITTDSLWNMKGINNAIKIFRPQIILIDDLDRSNHPKMLLDRIDDIRNNAQLLIVSANSLKDFDAAMLRPSRFDKITEIKELDEKTIEKILHGVSEETKDKLKKLPIAYIHEYSTIKNVIGDKMAEKQLENMIERADFIKEHFEKKEDKDKK